MQSKVVNSITLNVAIALISVTVFMVAVPFAKACNMYVVSFISLGAGIDHDTAQDFEDFLSTEYPDLIYEANPAGREGELDYCFDLSVLSIDQQATFRQKSAQILQKSKLVQISELERCPKKLKPPGRISSIRKVD